ncbi:MAG TPA: cytochrome c [Phenylobacterium sp.]|jgi:cytochrome c556|nr:cytochrome c [Phenylobacterium sp.]
MALKTMLAAAVLTAGLIARTALAQDPASASPTPGGKAVVVRQAHYKELNAAFRVINEQLRSEAPDKGAISANAARMKALAADLPSWSPKGSGPEAGVKTAAKAEIWTDAEGFAAAATRLQGETAKLADTAAAGDMDALKAQVRATGGACKACHDKYRAS